MSVLKSNLADTEKTVFFSMADALKDLTLPSDNENYPPLYNHISEAIKAGKKVILSFKDAEDDLTWAFLSSSIGQLYGHFPDEVIQSSLSFVDISEDDLESINDVIYWEKRYLEDPERFKEATREFLGDEDE